MASLQIADKQSFASAEALRAHYDGVRRRLSASRPPPPPQCSEADLVPAPSEEPLIGSTGFPPKVRFGAPPALPREFMQIADAVAAALAISRDELLTGLDDLAKRGRRMVAALLVRRVWLSRGQAAIMLGTSEHMVSEALRTLNIVLTVSQASVWHTDLGPLCVALAPLWEQKEPGAKTPPVEAIQRAVAKAYNVSLADMVSARRTANVVEPRQVAMYLAKRLTLRSLPEIGRRFGGRDHTTVLHAVRKMAPSCDPVVESMPEATAADLAAAIFEARKR